MPRHCLAEQYPAIALRRAAMPLLSIAAANLCDAMPMLCVAWRRLAVAPHLSAMPLHYNGLCCSAKPLPCSAFASYCLAKPMLGFASRRFACAMIRYATPLQRAAMHCFASASFCTAMPMLCVTQVGHCRAPEVEAPAFALWLVALDWLCMPVYNAKGMFLCDSFPRCSSVQS